MAHRSGKLVNLTITVDSGMLILAKHRALIERTSVNRVLADALEDYADGAMDAARRTHSAAFVYGVVEEVRRLRRSARVNQAHHVIVVQTPTESERAPYAETDRERPEYLPLRDEGASTEA